MLRELGYVDGKNITFEYRNAELKFDRLPALADELVRLNVDVLLVNTTPVALAAKNATRTIPIVFFSVSDPVTAGLVDSLARPGGTLRESLTLRPFWLGNDWSYLRKRYRTLLRVAVLWDPQAPGSTQQWKESQLPARELGLQLHSMEVSSADKYENAFKQATKVRSAALAVTQNPVTVSNRKRIADLAAKNSLPAIYPRGDFVTSGGLMSYGGDEAEPYRRGAIYVDKILKGRQTSGPSC